MRYCEAGACQNLAHWRVKAPQFGPNNPARQALCESCRKTLDIPEGELIQLQALPAKPTEVRAPAAQAQPKEIYPWESRT